MATRGITEFGKFQSEQQKKSSAGGIAFDESDPTIYSSGFAMEDSVSGELQSDVTELKFQVSMHDGWITKWIDDFKRIAQELQILKAGLAKNDEDDLIDSLMWMMKAGNQNYDAPSCDSDSTITATKVNTLQYYAGATTDHKGELEMYGAQDLADGNYWAPYLTKATGTGTLGWSKYDQKSLNANETGSLIEIYGWLGGTPTTALAATDMALFRVSDGTTKYATIDSIITGINAVGTIDITRCEDPDAWRLGGTSLNCYGQAIGDLSSATPIINLYTKQLMAGTYTPAVTFWSVASGLLFKVLDTTDNDGNVNVGAFQVVGGMSVAMKSYFGDNMKLASGKSFSVGTDVLTIREVELVDHATGEPVVVKILST